MNKFECTCSLHQPEDEFCPGCTEWFRLKKVGFPDYWQIDASNGNQRFVHSRKLYNDRRYPMLYEAQVVNQIDTPDGRADGIFVHLSAGLTNIDTKIAEVEDVLALLKWIKNTPRGVE